MNTNGLFVTLLVVLAALFTGSNGDPEPTFFKKHKKAARYYQPVYHSPAPVYHHHAPVYHKPAPVYHKPASVYHRPAPVYHKPAPVYHKPAPVHHRPVYGGYGHGW
ncbi:unnamed protein product [Meganyctiphanes norvegica]|uniref:Uncharacterized protein n=1 Tax=Meganyctiphanes norvegica TaxID=48144 RepID=A0AAV2RHE1_MEGNR